MTDWGELKLVRVSHGTMFITLLDELCDDGSSFRNNAGALADAFRDGNLYSLCYTETDSMYEQRIGDDPLFVRGFQSIYLIPCICMINKDTIEIMWVHTRARKRGFASKIVKLLNLPYVYNPLPGSEEFWKKRGIEIILIRSSRALSTPTKNI